MAAPRLKVGGLDLSEFLRTQPDESPAIDPAGDYFRPQFSGAPALAEGQMFVGDAVDNRQMIFPLYVTGATRALIKLKIEEINEALVRGAQVEFAIDPSVEGSSFFDLEGGTLVPQFNVYHLINAVAGAVLTLTVRPYANTATHRLIASIRAATSAVVMFPATGILGDTYALANLEVRVGSAVASAGRVVAWGMHPNASHRAYQAATSGLAQTGATVRGASGAIGSQYTAIPVSPTGASGIAYTAYLEPVAAHVGRHRIIAVGRSALNVGIPLYAEDRFGAILGATAIASQTDVNKWQVIDLGEVNVPARASGQEAIPTQYVNIYGGGASGALINASGALHLNGILFLPLDYSAGIMRTPGGRSAFDVDSFKRFPYGAWRDLESLPIADVGGAWANIAGRLQGNNSIMTPGSGLNSLLFSGSGPFAVNASAMYAFASGTEQHDVISQMQIRLANPFPSRAAASAALTLWPQALSNASTVTGGVGAKLQFGPSQTLQILRASSNGFAAVLASAGIASTLASGLFEGQNHSLVAKTVGGHIDVWLATGVLSASPVLSADTSIEPGWPVVAANQGTSLTGAGLLLQSFSVGPVGSTADINPRNYFRFESHPESRVYQGNASVFEADRLANFRGQSLKVPPVGSPAASGPGIVCVLQGEIDNIQGLDGADISLTVLERYRFLGGN